MPTDAYFGTLLSGGIVGLLFVIFIAAFSTALSYLFFKAAIRNGIIEAYKKMGIDGGSGGAGLVNGYPPAQSYGPPPAPTYSGYQGPNA